MLDWTIDGQTGKLSIPHLFGGGGRLPVRPLPGISWSHAPGRTDLQKPSQSIGSARYKVASLMKRRMQWLGFWVACACLSFSAGCEALRSQGLRGGSKSNHDRDAAYEGYLDSFEDEPKSLEDPKNFFSRTRRPGGLSDEARSIERDIFNIY